MYRVVIRYAWMVAVIVALAAPLAAQELPVKVSHTDKNIRYLGRFDFMDAAGPRAAWPGVSVIFRFQGTAANAVMKDFPSNRRRNSTRKAVNYFNIIVDSGEPTVLALDSSKTIYAIARNLKPGAHTVEIFRRTEPLWGKHQFLRARNKISVTAFSLKKFSIFLYNGRYECKYRCKKNSRTLSLP